MNRSITDLVHPSTKDNFEEIRDLHIDAAEEFDEGHPHHDIAAVLLTSAHTLHDINLALTFTGGGGDGAVSKREVLQLTYLGRGSSALFGLYWAVKYHGYSTAYGRIRFLLELYLLLRDLNRDKQLIGRKFEAICDELRQLDPDPGNKEPFADYIGGRRGNAKGDFTGEHPAHGEMYDRLSTYGSHPFSVRSAWHDDRRSEIMEQDALLLGCIFAFGLAAQYVRTFEDTHVSQEIEQLMNDIFVDVPMYVGELPQFFNEDAEFCPGVLLDPTKVRK